METLTYILKMLYYLVFALCLYSVAQRNAFVGSSDSYSGSKQSFGTIVIHKKRIPIVLILLFCVVIGYYGMICGQVPIASDRRNYAVRFSNDSFSETVKASSLGLYILESFLHLFSYDPYVLFFAIPFVCLALYLFAYNDWDDLTPLAMLMLVMSACINYSFYQFKQAPALGFMALSFSAFFKRKKIPCIIYLIIAIIFHESAWVMIPLYLVMLGSKNRWVRIGEFVFLAVCVVGFASLNSIMIRLFNYIPGMSFQLQAYLNDSGAVSIDSNLATIVKGIPYYIITGVGIAQRPYLKEKINGYDKYLTLSIFGSACILISAYMYWMWRFGSYTYFPMFIFASLIHREIGKNAKVFKYSVVLSLFFFTFRAFAQFYFLYGGY